MSTASFYDITDQALSLDATAKVVTASDFGSLSARRPFVFVGCGASYHAASAAAALLSALGTTPAVAVPASDLWMNPDVWLQHDAVVVGLSRTGTTTETVAALRTAGERGATTVGISLTAGTGVVTDVDQAIVLDHVGEQGRVMTRSFANLLLAAQLVAVRAAETGGGRDDKETARYLAAAFGLSAPVGQAMDAFDRQARQLSSSGSGHVVFLGSGPDIGVCRQAALQTQETARAAVEAHAVLDYRHGPLASLTSETVLIVVTTPRSVKADLVVAEDVATLGGQLIAVGPEQATSQFPDHVATVPVPTVDALWLQANATLPFLQLFGYHLTVRRGADPESVHNLDRTKQTHVNPHVLPDAMFSPIS